MDKDLILGEQDDFYVHELSSRSFSSFIFSKINVYGHNIFQIDGISGKTQTFEELYCNARILSTSILRLGILPGETIAVSCENRLEYGTVMMASLFTGTVFAPVNPAYTPDEIVHAFSISKPKVIFCSAYTYKNVSLSLQKLKGVNHVILFDEMPLINSSSAIQFGTLLQNKPIDKPYQSKDEEVAVILTSSGTTGLPKGVMLSYANLKYFCTLSMSSSSLNLQPDNVILGLLPFYHGYGYGIVLSSIVIGMKIVLLPKFEEKLFLSTIQKYKITNLFLVPPLMVFLGKHPLVTQYNLSSVREVVSGAAPLSREISELVQARLPAADLRQGYGMTETSVVITISPPHSNKPHSVGKLSVNLQAKIVDVETGKPLGREQPGEILVRGPCVMVGYCNDPEATRQTIDGDGWLHTGDIGYVDNQDFFYIVDRLKELIKYKGFQVAPAELESILMGLSGVKDAAVVGVPDVVAGELPVAYIVLQPNTSLTETAIINFVNGKVSPQKWLRGVRFIESVPRNPSGKILRRIIRDGLNSKL